MRHMLKLALRSGAKTGIDGAEAGTEASDEAGAEADGKEKPRLLWCNLPPKLREFVWSLRRCGGVPRGENLFLQ